MKYIIFIILSIGIILFYSCKEVTEPGTSSRTGDWAIPVDKVYDGGPGKDGIPALENPTFTSLSAAQYLQDDDLVVGVRADGVIKAYPHKILNWHEIANDNIGNKKLAVTYCPLTGSAIGWNRIIDGNETTFGVSGLLYNTNLMPYDRKTNSTWSQMLLECVNGSLIGNSAETYNVIETNWSTWKKMFPNSVVLSTNTGYSREYGLYPYGDYNVNHDYFLFPVDFWDRKIESKVRVLGIELNGKSIAFQIHKFSRTGSIIKTNFEGKNLIIVGSSGDNFAAAFFPFSGGDSLSLDLIKKESTAILQDTEGNIWDLFGFAVSGPRQGFYLDKPKVSYIAFWFAWSVFHPETVLGN